MQFSTRNGHLHYGYHKMSTQGYSKARLCHTRVSLFIANSLLFRLPLAFAASTFVWACCSNILMMGQVWNTLTFRTCCPDKFSHVNIPCFVPFPPPCLAYEGRCTLGEISSALEESWGRHQPSTAVVRGAYSASYNEPADVSHRCCF